jgi:hypothetical protein
LKTARIGDAPVSLEEGTVLELCLAEPEDGMGADELAQLRSALDAGWRSMQAGRFRPAADIVAELRAKR